MAENASFSLHAQLIREQQTEEGKTLCFATEPSDKCSNIQCRLRHDCFADFLDTLAENTSPNQI